MLDRVVPTSSRALHGLSPESAAEIDDLNDALYAASGGPIRLAPLASSKHVGVEMDLTVKYKFVRGLAALVGYSHFFAGRFLAESGPDEDVDFGYLQLQYTF